MKRILWIALFAVLIIGAIGCNAIDQRRTDDQLFAPLETPGPHVQGGTEKKGEATMLDLTLENGVHVVIKENGKMELSGADVTSDTFQDAGDRRLTKELETVRTVSFGDGVSAIEKVFEGNTSLQVIEIGKSVKTIGEDAFSGCSALKEIRFKGEQNLQVIEAYAFEDCTSLKTIQFDAVQTLGKNAFYNCTGLKRVSIGSFLIPEKTGENVFKGCSNITDVTILSNVPTGLFADLGNVSTVSLGEGVTSIGEKAFAGCSGLESITLPSVLTTVGENAFADCTSLKTVIFGKELTTIGNGAFSKCTSLESVAFGENVKEIGESAFSGCAKLERVTFPANLSRIKASAFAECETLKTVVIPGDVTEIGAEAFISCKALNELTIENNVFLMVGEKAFASCGNLESVRIQITNPGTIDFQKKVFMDCTGLREIDFQEGVTSLGESVLEGCEKLQTVTLPKSLKSIGKYAFNNCELSRLNYRGNNNQWKEMMKGENQRDWCEARNIPNTTSVIKINYKG